MFVCSIHLKVLCRGGGRCRTLGVLITFPFSTFLHSRNIGGAKCLYFTYFKKCWGCYSTPSTPQFRRPCLVSIFHAKIIFFPLKNRKNNCYYPTISWKNDLADKAMFLVTVKINPVSKVYLCRNIKNINP